MSEEIKEQLDAQNQGGEENSEQNLNAQSQEDNKENSQEDEKVTLSKKDYQALIGQKEYYQTQYKELKKDPVKKTGKESDNVSDDRTIVLEIRQDYPQLTKEEAEEIAAKAKRVASLEGKKINEALTDEYIKSSIDSKLKQKASEDASISSSRSPKGSKPSGDTVFKPNMTESEKKAAYQAWLSKQR